MLSAFISSILSYPAMLLAEQLVHQRYVHPGPLVLRTDPLKFPTPATDRDRTVSRRSEPSSRTALMGEQPNPWDLLQPLRPNSSNIHTRPFPYCLQSFQDGYTVCIVLFLCHFSLHIALCSLAIFLHCYLMTKKNLIETRLLSVSQLYSKSF